MSQVQTDPGWTQINRFLSPAEVDQAVSITAALRALPADQRHPRDKPASGTVHVAALDQRSVFIDDLLNRPSLLETVTAILGDSFTRDDVELRSPQPSFGQQRLHADDLPKLTAGPCTVATALISLVEFTPINGSTRVVPGSHQRPDLQRASGTLQDHPDAIQLVGPAGTAFVFSGHLLHSGTTNRSEAERPALHAVWRRARP